MRIGKLNDLLSGISFEYTFTGSKLIPQTQLAGNPAKGETFALKWETVRDGGISLHFTLPKPAFVDRLAVTVGEKTALTSMELFLGEQPLSRHTAETGKCITAKSVELEAGEVCDALTLVLWADFSNIEVLSVDFYGAVEDGLDLFPTPNAVTVGGSTVPADRFSGCCTDSPEGQRAAEILAEKYAEKTGVQLTVGNAGNICFRTDRSIVPDGCHVEVTETGATVSASNLRGFVYGAETFIKLTDAQAVHTATVSDSPAVPFRGVHLFIPSEDKMPFARRLVKYLLSPMGYNTVILQVSGGMIFDSHPNISAAFENAVKMSKQGLCPPFPHNGVAEGKPITKDMLRSYVDYIRSFGIEVIPEVQSLGHVQYMTHAYPEIAEIPEAEEMQNVDTRNEDKLPSQYYRHCFCPSNPRSYEILFDLLDEIIEVFRPKEYVHMGHDEVYQIGVCKVCKSKSPAELLAYDLNKIHGYLAKKGLKMMIWGDMLQPVTKYQTHPAIDLIPKDIVLMDFIWYFHLDKDIEENLLSKDFKVIYGNVYSSHFPRYESRIRKDGILGGQISAWVATSEAALQQEGKLYDFLMTAQMFWSDAYRKVYTLTYDNMIRAMMPQLRENLSGVKRPSRMAGAAVETLAENTLTFPPRLPVAQQGEIPVGDRFDSLVFWHTALRKNTRLPWTAHDVIGKYILHYEDGSAEEIPITASGNIGFWNRRQNQPLTHKLYRHTGYTATYYTDSVTERTEDGQPVTVYRFEYIPQKHQPIRSVTLEQNPEFDVQVYLAKAEGVTVK